MKVSGGSGCRVAVYGEIDPNLVDGSSVWLQSICQVLASLDGVEVTLLLRRPLEPERRFLLEALEVNDAIELVDGEEQRPLGPAEALDLLQDLDRERHFDVVLLRGQMVLAEAAGRDGFDGRLWSYAMTGRGMPDETLRALGSRSSRLLCQTEAVAAELREIVPAASGSILVLPPMIPDLVPPPTDRGAGERPPRLVYSGKLAPDYCWLETVEAFRTLRSARHGAELHVIGDKVYRPPEFPDFPAEAMRALHETDGVRWHGAVPRTAVHGLLAECDLALSIRNPGVEAAREISTKVLEYGVAGLPVVLNRAPAYERLLGKDYPLFISDPAEAGNVLTGPALDPELRTEAASACHAASRDFTFSSVAARLADHLPQPAPSSPLTPSTNGSSPDAKPITRVLVAGHDLKFLGPIREAIAGTGATLAEDLWRSHTGHNEAASHAALEEADVMLCEWCLGNAVWYSHNKRPDQRLVVRLHRMEVYTEYPAGVEIDNVDQVVCVSQHIADEAIRRFGWDTDKLSVIPNSVDVDRFRLPKHDAARFAVAMIGYTPKRKRLDRAVDIFEELRREEDRFHLQLIGHPPSEFDWVVSRPEETDFFRHCLARIQESPILRGAVTVQPFSGDLPSLLQGVGFILSTSDSEGHQVALAEGAASGAVPVIVDRPGAREQYPSRWIHQHTRGVAEAIGDLSAEEWSSEGTVAADHAAGWAPQVILPRWVEVLGLGGQTLGGAAQSDRAPADSYRQA